MSSPPDNKASANPIEAQLGKQVGAVQTQLGKQADAVAKQATGAVGKKAPKLTLKDAGAELSQLPLDTSSPLVWAGGAALALGLSVLCVWLWRRKKSGAAAKADTSASAASDQDLYADWRAFRRRLPARIKRVLDDFQPVILLGNTASEKEQVALQLSGVAEREREYPSRVSLAGEGLSVYLGSRSVVLAPSEAFLKGAGAESNASWRRLLRKVCAVRAPRVVVCLSQAPLESDDLAEITAWASTLRRHIDLIIATRNEDIEVSVALAQAPPASGVRRQTDALFELMDSLSQHEGAQATLRASLAGLTESISEGSEDRRSDGELWASQTLRRYRRGWPRLLAHGDQPSRLLELAQLFEHLPRLSGCLGAALGELFVNEGRQSGRSVGAELVFLPVRKQKLVGTLSAFSGPRDEDDEGARWHPSRMLLHRVGVASGFGVLAVVMWLVYASDRAAWDTAATAALRYDPPEKSQELKLVREYLEGRMSRPAFVLPEFFERDLLRCLVVDAGRRFVSSRIDQAVRALSPPETVLQLTALYLSGTPTDCGAEMDLVEDGYRDLGATIEENIEQWRQITDLSVEELSGYLSLACPQTHMELAEIRRVYSVATPTGSNWQAVPDAAKFGADLQVLRGTCGLTDEERDAIERAELFSELSSDMGQKHGATYSVLRATSELNTSTMATLSSVFGRFRPRFAALENLAGEHDELELLARDVRPFSDQRWHHRPLRVGSVRQFTEQLGAFMAGEIPEGEDAVVRMTFDSNTFVIDRRKVRTSLLTRALGELRTSFTRAVEANEILRGTPEAMFFEPAAYEQSYTWLPASVIPAGVELVGSVPQRYTIEGFTEQVLEPLEDMRRLLGPRACAANGAAAEDVAGELSRFVQERLDAYLVEYGKVWQGIYTSFRVTAEDDDELSEVLTALSRPTSPQLALLREVLRQTALVAGEQSPFAPSLALARAPFETLPAAADERAFQDYRGLIVDLANASQPQPDGAAAPAPGRAAVPNAEQSLDDLMSGLSGFGRVVLAGLRDPKQDLRARAHAWAQGVALAPGLRGVLIAPFDAAYASGEANLAMNLGRWWESRRQELERAVYWRFPFNSYGSTDALVADVIAWLDPREGRFVSEVKPIYDLVNQCSGKPCVTLPSSLSATIQRTNAIAHTLFDDKGQPKPIALQLEPIPFAQQRFAPRRSSFQLESLRSDYFNTAPRGATLSIPWNEARVARLEVELVGESGVDGFAVPIDTESSPWAVFHLLQRAAEKASGRYQWELDVTGRGVRVGKSSVSYRVCQDVTLCNGLFTEALEWL